MRLLNFCFVLVVLCGVFDKSDGTELNCEFRNIGFTYGRSFYTCYVSSLDNTNNNMVITGYSGTPDKNVEAIYIHQSNTKYIPKDLGLLFNLTALWIYSSQLVQIKSEDFKDMKNLVELSLGHNLLEEIPNGVFNDNPELKWIRLWNNKIKFIGSSVFDGLTKLDFVELRENICIDEEYRGNTEIIQLKYDIKSQCKNPNELPPTTTQAPTEASTSTTQNPVELQLSEVKELNINLEKENLELKQNLLDSKTAHDKDQINRAELQTKIKDLNDRLTICDAQKSTDMKFEDIKNMFINLERIGNETLMKSKDETTMNSGKETLELTIQICKLEQGNAELNSTLTAAQNDLQDANEKNSKLELESNALNKEILEARELRQSERMVIIETKKELLKLNQQRLEAVQETDRVKEELKEAQSQVNRITVEKKLNN